MNVMQNGLTHDEEDQLYFDQNILGEFMALDTLKEQQPDVFKTDIGDPKEYDIYSEGDVQQAEISRVQAHQNHETLIEGLQENNNKETRKQVVLAEHYASKISSLVMDIMVSEQLQENLDKLNEMEAITKSYDLPRGFETFQKRALDHIFKARYRLINHSHYNDDRDYGYDYSYEETDQYKAEQAMEMIESEIGRFEDMEQENFEGYHSGDVQEYAEYQLDIAQKGLFDNELSDEQAMCGLDNALKAMRQLPTVIKRELKDQEAEDAEEKQSYFDDAGEFLSENQLYMCNVVHDDYPELDIACIKLLHEQFDEDFDEFEEKVSDFYKYLRKNTNENQRVLFLRFMDEQYSLIPDEALTSDEDVKPNQSDILENLNGLCEDFPTVKKNIVEAFYHLNPQSFDKVQEDVSDFSHYAKKHNWTRQTKLYIKFLSTR